MNFKNHLKYILVFFETLFLILGVILPIARIDEFWFFSSEFSILSVSKDLFLNSEILLSVIIITFGFLFPLLKIFLKVFEIEKIKNLSLHKFSMVDIFLLSFIVFAGKTSNYFEVHLMHGFYFLLASIILGFVYLIIEK